MITDPIFYRLFETSPETFFLLLGMGADTAIAMAARYQYQALEFKETSHRADGVFAPREADLPVYFLEVQFYPLASVYADVLAKTYTYLKQHDPKQPYCAVVLFGSRDLEPAGLASYQPLLEAGLLRRIFLDEIPTTANAPLGLAILSLIPQADEQAGTAARNLVARAKSEIEDESLRADLVQLIETVIIYKLPRMNREEIQAMLKVHDIRESLVYQEALQEGIEKERQRTRQLQLDAVAKLAARHMTAAEIADVLGLEVELVAKMMAEHA